MWALRDSNPRPSACKADALNQLRPVPSVSKAMQRYVFFSIRQNFPPVFSPNLWKSAFWNPPKTPGGRRRIQNITLSKRQNSPRENRANEAGTGMGRKYGILANLRECRMKGGSLFSATLCRPPLDAVRTDAAPASAGRGGRPAKRQTVFACGRPPTRRKNPSEASFFFDFHTPENCLAARKSRLCGKKGISLRKEIPFVPHENARRGGEMFHTDSSRTRFLTLRGLFPPCFPATRMPTGAESLPLWQENPRFSDIPTLVRLWIPHGISTEAVSWHHAICFCM